MEGVVGVETVGIIVVGVVLKEPVAPEAGGVFVIVEGGGGGGVVTTGALWVEPLAPVDCAEAFPAASYAETV